MHWFTSYLVRPESKQRTTASSADLQAAVDAYNRDHARDWGRTGGTCPICDHHGCFGNAGGKLRDAGRWACFSANHGDVGVKLGACYHGDALDVDAYQNHRTRAEHLRAKGYLQPPELTQDRKPRVNPTTDTPTNKTNVPDLTAYLADFLRERRAVLAIENPTWTPRQVNAEARRLLARIQAREGGAHHA